MRLKKIAYDMARKIVQIVDIAHEKDATSREVQCEGSRDETATGREIFRAAWNLGPAGFKHFSKAGEKALVLRLLDGIILGSHMSDGEPTDLDEGDTAIYNDSGTAQVRCKGSIVEIGITGGGLIIRKDRFTTWWNATPKFNYGNHVHPGVMAGPASTGVTPTPLGDVGTIECDDGHKVK